MIPDFNHMDLESLIDTYTREAAALKQALLDGVLWEEVKERRRRVTRLAIAIHRYKKGIGDDPATVTLRRANREELEDHL